MADWLGQPGRMPAARIAWRERLTDRGEQNQAGVDQRGLALIARASARPSMPGICRSEQRQLKGLTSAGGAPQQVEAATPPLALTPRIRQAARWRSRMVRLVRCHRDQHPQPVDLSQRRGTDGGGDWLSWSRVVKQKVLRLARWLVNPIWPPISSTSR